ncbi:prepilin-type N-terminal cleavage/methylation domain-containing protein [bacterium]|nr:prepilin-type N-terminal cleavage/methylation domain-containing protein [bacterium]
MKNRKGFTLIEIMIVVVIIGVLAGLAIPRFTKASRKSKVSEARLMVKNIYKAVMMYYESYGDYPKNFGWAGWWIFNNASTKNTNWNHFPGLKVDRPSGYPRFTYVYWSAKNHIYIAAWAYLPDSWDKSIVNMNDLRMYNDGRFFGGDFRD